MSQYQKERHAAAMLVHNIASGIEALQDMRPDLVMDNYQQLNDCFVDLANLLIRIGDIEAAKNELVRNHQ